MFGVKELQINESASKYLSRGLNNRVVIGNIEGFEPEGANPYINLTVYKENSTIEDGRTFKLSMAPTAMKYSLMKLTHIATKIISNEDLVAIDEASNNSVIEFARRLDAVLSGQTLNWMKISVEVYRNVAGETKERLVLGLPPFADNSAQTKIRYDETNKYDYKPLVETVKAAPTGDLPF